MKVYSLVFFSVIKGRCLITLTDIVQNEKQYAIYSYIKPIVRLKIKLITFSGLFSI
jgi:hypothetical protein